MRRVVVTGMGIVSPLGIGIDHVWRRLINGESGIARIRSFDPKNESCQVAAEVPRGQRSEHKFDASDWISPEEQKGMGRFAQFALAAATEAVEDSGWHPTSEPDRNATGVSMGTGFGAIDVIYDSAVRVHKGDGRGISPAFADLTLINTTAARIAATFGAGGPIRAVATACASGVHAIGDATRLIQAGDADVMMAGASEAAVCELVVGGFLAARALSTRFNDQPEQASRPWDEHRDGFVMGEGAAMVVLEGYEHARSRGAKIYAEVAGYGMSGDANHITAPAEGHEGAVRAMRAALRNGRITTDDVQYINAHGTSTPLGDDLELEAVERLFGASASNLAMSSTKSAVGHLLGAAGAVEAVFSILAVRDSVVPPTLNLQHPSRASRIDRVANIAQERKVRHAVCNSFGFGGTNSVIAFRAM